MTKSKDGTFATILIMISMICIAFSSVGGLNLSFLSSINWVSGDYTTGAIWGYCPKNPMANIPSPTNVTEVLNLPVCITIFDQNMQDSASQSAQSIGLKTPNASWTLYYLASGLHISAFACAFISLIVHWFKYPTMSSWMCVFSWLLNITGFSFGIVIGSNVANLINTPNSTYDRNGKFGPAVAFSGFASVLLILAALFLHNHDKRTRGDRRKTLIY